MLSIDYIKFGPQYFNYYIFCFELFLFHPLQYDFYINFDPHSFDYYLLFSYPSLTRKF
jgi:hypothetical protein